MDNIRIKEVELYHPNKIVSNGYYLEHFKQRNKDIEHFIVDIMGRNNRYIIDNDYENGLTMGIEAAKKVLRKAGIIGSDIDMIIFSTQTPEYTFPTNAIFIHKAIEAKSETICLDLNSNCAGMVVAVEQTCRYMMANPQINYALVVGSDFNSINCNPEDEITYANYGDASSAVILEKTSTHTGFIDSLYFTDSEGASNIMFPACGLSNIYNNPKNDDIQIKWIPFDGTCVVEPAIKSVEKLMAKHKISKEEIGAFCFSQFSYKNIELIQEGLGVDIDKFIYVGDEFGYTGTSSPFLALCRGEERGQIKRGDYIFFWTVGTGWQIITMLFKY